MLDSGIPAFGICLGHQLTALAAGAKTTKLKYGPVSYTHLSMPVKRRASWLTSRARKNRRFLYRKWAMRCVTSTWNPGYSTMRCV